MAQVILAPDIHVGGAPAVGEAAARRGASEPQTRAEFDVVPGLEGHDTTHESRIDHVALGELELGFPPLPVHHGCVLDEAEEQAVVAGTWGLLCRRGGGVLSFGEARHEQ